MNANPQTDQQDPEIPVKAGLGQAVLALFLSKIALSLYGKIAARLKLYAIKNVPNQWLMSWIATHDNDPKMRAAAVKKVVRPKVLVNLFNREKHPKVRSAILAKMPPAQQVVEYRVAHTRKQKQEVVKHIIAQEALAKVLTKERDPILAMEILPRISNMELLRPMKNHSLKEVRDWFSKMEGAIERRNNAIDSNPKVLLDAILSIAKMDAHLRRLLSWVHTPDLWYALAIQHEDHKVRQAALDNLEAYQPLLAKIIADKSLKMGLRAAALTNLQDSNIIKHLVGTIGEPLRSQVASKLNPVTDGAVISKLLATENDPDVLSAVIMVCNTPADLSALVERLEGNEKLKGISLLAQSRLKKL